MSMVIENARIVNEGKTIKGYVCIDGELITEVGEGAYQGDESNRLDAEGKYLIPGMIDDQVHFREPGLTHKAEIMTESRAAVAGGITSFMEMPNTVPQATTIELLEDKFSRAADVSAANYSFFLGTTNKNLDQLLRLDPKKHVGVKIFMGSSTGDMVVDDIKALDETFAKVKTIILTHCEDDPMIKAEQAKFEERYGDDIPMRYHKTIRSREACYKSSSFAVELAKKHGTRLHILHISSKEELDLFTNDIPLEEKRITSEACVHHMWFGGDEDYDKFGSRIKWNPAVKEKSDAEAILEAVKDGRIDVVATDHAPHTKEEKSNTYTTAPSGGPLVQHALNVLFEFVHQGKLTVEKLVEKAAHNPAKLFAVEGRGFIKEGYKADLVLVDDQRSYTVDESNILYKCGWSPFEGTTFHSVVDKTWVNGQLVYSDGRVDHDIRGQRLSFDR